WRMIPLDESTTGGAPVARGRARLLLCACAALALLLGGVRFGDESYVSLQGDMPRHLMNGVFFRDALYDLPFGSIGEAAEYARYYYARYPALSIGHHPFLIALAEAPLYAVFGVSVTTARVVSLTFFVIGVLYLYKLVSELFDPWAGAAAAAVYASSAQLVDLAQAVMTETSALALLVVAAYYSHRFAVTGRSRAIVMATLLAAGSVWAKQLAVVALPGLVVHVWWRVGWRRLLRADVVGATLLSAVVVAPLVPITLMLSPFNVGHAVGAAMSINQAGRLAYTAGLLGEAFRMHFSWPVLALSAAGFVLLLVRRPALALTVLVWVASTLVFVGVVGNQDAVRYSIYWIPPLALCFGALASRAVGPRSVVVGVLLLVAIATQVAASSTIRQAGAHGYEEAAEYVVANPRGSTVMFAGDVDTGFFTFFVRKHDSARAAIVIRADKVLTTSMMDKVAAEDRISDPAQIADIVRRFGVGYVVVEDRPSASKVQNWLLDDLKSARYVERLRVPTGSTDPRLRNISVVVYEVSGATSAAADARLEIKLPLVSQQIDISLSDLIARKYLR
ncbi:MAG TPA: glycosyltransferase family 39 protein, partial [Vicinamibacterales bacterium]|nr:glycosyltransferase family 39 protein [Vicinamibacterales bacterium]